jgi:hypothetical protein
MVALSKKGVNTVLAGGGAPISIKKPPKRLIMIIAAIFIVLAIAFIYLGLSISAALKAAPPTSQPIQFFTHKPVSSTGLISQQLLSYGQGALVIPYLLLHYSASNVSSMSVSVSLYQRPPPTGNVYILNWSNQCVGCKGFDVNGMVVALDKDLANYSAISPSSGVQLITAQQLPNIQNNSVLIVVNGRLPDYMAKAYTSGIPMITYLMEKGITVFYVGRNFSQVIAPQSVIQPNPDTNELTYLQT